jgi:2-iminoacetate synthase ThiH
MSALVDRAIDAAGLTPLLAARTAGRAAPSDGASLRSVDLLALGALADRVRRDEVGDEVRVYTRASGDGDDSRAEDAAAEAGTGSTAIVLPPEGRTLTGLELLREVAIARVTGPRGARVRVDWTRAGLEIAQVALGFGANELEGRIANKRGLPMAEGERLGVLGKASRLEDADVVKRKELEGFVRRAGRTPRFAEEAP